MFGIIVEYEGGDILSNTSEDRETIQENLLNHPFHKHGCVSCGCVENVSSNKARAVIDKVPALQVSQGSIDKYGVDIYLLKGPL